MSNVGPTHVVQCESLMYYEKNNLEEDLRKGLAYGQPENNTKYQNTEDNGTKKKTLRRATSGSQILMTSPNVPNSTNNPQDVHTVHSPSASNARVHQQGFSLRNTQELSVPQNIKNNNNIHKNIQNTKNHNPFSNFHQLHHALDNNIQLSVTVSLPPPICLPQYQPPSAVQSFANSNPHASSDLLQQAFQRIVGTPPSNPNVNHFVPKTPNPQLFNLHQSFPAPNINWSVPSQKQQQYRALHKNLSKSAESLDFPELAGRYKVLEKVGEGTFSSVYTAVVNNGTNAIVALKRINPTCSPSRIINEINCLKKLGGRCHVPPILGAMRLFDQVTLVLPYLPHTKFKDYLPFFTLKQMRDYMHALFTALHHVHVNGIIHRDIKPGNFLFQAETNTFLLVDFGLAATTKQPHNDHPSPVKLPHSYSADNLLTQRSSPLSKASTSPLPYTAVSSPTHSNSNLPSPQLSPTPTCEDSNSKHADSDSELTAPKKHTETLPLSPLTRKRSYDSLTSFPQSPGPSNNNTNSSYNDSVDSDASFTPSKSKRNKSSSSSENLHLWNPSRFANNNTTTNVGPQKMQAQVFQTSTDLSHKDMAHAPRAGTRGFRAPEVLMRSWEQTTALDIWSAGVIMLSLFSTRYPFFLSPDDMTGLAEVAAVFGTVEVFQAGIQLGRRILFPRVFPKQNLKTLCQCLSQARNIEVPDSGYDLLEKCLSVNPRTRITAEEALAHSFFQE